MPCLKFREEGVYESRSYSDLVLVEDEEFLVLAADIADNDPPFAAGFLGAVGAKADHVAGAPVLDTLHLDRLGLALAVHEVQIWSSCVVVGDQHVPAHQGQAAGDGKQGCIADALLGQLLRFQGRSVAHRVPMLQFSGASDRCLPKHDGSHTMSEDGFPGFYGRLCRLLELVLSRQHASLVRRGHTSMPGRPDPSRSIAEDPVGYPPSPSSS